MSFEDPFNSAQSPEDKAKAEKKSGAPNKASRWLKRAAALAGAMGLGYVASVREKGPGRHSPVNPSAAAPAPISEKATSEKKTRLEVRYVKIAEGIEAPREVEVNEKGEIVKVLEQKSEQKTPSGNFSGYGVTVESKNGDITKSDYGSEESGKKKFSGYGIETESDESGVSKSPYGSKSGDGKKFRGYGIEH